MKGKITIVLLGLALVFGMIAASCDNGAYPAVDAKDQTTLFAYDGTKTNDSPNIPLSLKKGDDVYKLLAMQVANPDPTKGGFIPKYLLTKTAGLKPGDDTTTAGTDNNGDSLTVAQAKAKYPGMQIIINNPATGLTGALSSPTDPDPVDTIYPPK